MVRIVSRNTPRAIARQIAYSFEDAWVAAGLKSESALRAAWNAGDISAHYASPRNPVFLDEDLLEWVRSLPVDRPPT